VGLTSLPAQLGDGRNTLQWVHSGWVELGFPSTAPGATDVRYEKKDGVWQIVEADIYLNAESFQWSQVPTVPVYLEAVLVHELGHALGLLHPCEADQAAAVLAPHCDDVPGAAQTTMYPVYDPEQVTDADDTAVFAFIQSTCESWAVLTACRALGNSVSLVVTSLAALARRMGSMRSG
jgi:hypothetical protein